jgi:hypothetical protein
MPGPWLGSLEVPGPSSPDPGSDYPADCQTRWPSVSSESSARQGGTFGAMHGVGPKALTIIDHALHEHGEALK